MTETKQTLLPCPFCGRNCQYVEHLEGTVLHPAYRVLCDNCGASTGYTDKDCRADWNTRALPTDWQPTPEAINALPEPLRAYIHRIETSHPSYDNAVRIRQLEEQVEQLQAALGEEWRPIESAPQDGTEILLSNGRTTQQGWWVHDEGGTVEHRDSDGRYIDQDDSDGFIGWFDVSGCMVPPPTHWRPLPSPAAIDAMAAGEDAK